MTGKARFKSDAFAAVHSAALGLHRAGTIDKATMRGFDQTCLVAPPLIAPLQIKRIREQAGVGFETHIGPFRQEGKGWRLGRRLGEAHHDDDDERDDKEGDQPGIGCCNNDVAPTAAVKPADLLCHVRHGLALKIIVAKGGTER